MRHDSTSRAISPVVGVALLVVIVLALGAITGGIFLGIGDRLDEPAPIFASGGGQVEVGVENGTLVGQDLVLAHLGGQAIHTSNLVIALDSGTGTTRIDPGSSGDVQDGVWSVGEELPIPIVPATVCDGSDRLEISLLHEGEGTYVVSEKTVPLVKGGFTIEDGSLVPVSEYTATAKVLGAGFTYGAGGPNIDIRLDVVIGDTSYDPWPGNVNNNGNPRSHTFTDQPAGASIRVAATGDKNGVYVTPRTRWSNATDGWVYVLRDGDTPPNIGAFGDQNSAASYVGPYLDSDGEIALDDNQAIFLFELGNSQTGSAADFQDVVVLVSLQTQQTTVVETDTSGDRFIVCPGG